jgi:hypothetical protein
MKCAVLTLWTLLLAVSGPSVHAQPRQDVDAVGVPWVTSGPSEAAVGTNPRSGNQSLRLQFAFCQKDSLGGTAEARLIGGVWRTRMTFGG